VDQNPDLIPAQKIFEDSLQQWGSAYWASLRRAETAPGSNNPLLNSRFYKLLEEK